MTKNVANTEPFELCALVCFVIAAVSWVVLNVAQPNLGLFLPFLLAFCGVGLAPFGLGFFVVAFQKRRKQLFRTAPAYILLFAGLWYGGQDRLRTESYLREFQANRADLEQARLWLERQPKAAERFEEFSLPADLKHISVEAEGIRYTSSERVRSYAFVVFLYVDNSSGFIWTEDGKPPLPQSVPYELVRSKHLEGNWYLFHTT